MKNIIHGNRSGACKQSKLEKRRAREEVSEKAKR